MFNMFLTKSEPPNFHLKKKRGKNKRYNKVLLCYIKNLEKLNNKFHRFDKRDGLSDMNFQEGTKHITKI